MRKLIAPVVVAIVLILALVVGVNAQAFYTTMDNVIMRSLIVTNTAQMSGATSIAGALTGTSANFTSGISTNSSIVAYGSASVGTFLALTPGAMQVVSPDSTITPVASYQPISSTAAVGTSSIAAMASGTMLRLVNIGTQTITITDTGTLYLSGNIALGENDSLLLLSKGVGQGWVQVSTSNN
jgi:glucan phosphoethanolaminetransferase (alkaline phosphatase superfamily)